MSSITDSFATNPAVPAECLRGGAVPTKLTPAHFSDMSRGAIAAAVDQDGDGIFSGKETAARLASLDRDGNGKVTADEFSQGVDDPLATNRVVAVARLRHQISAGMSSDQPPVRVPGADGGASAPHSMLHFLANRFPGNVDV